MIESYILVFDRNAGTPAFLPWEGGHLTLALDDAKLFDTHEAAERYRSSQDLNCSIGIVLTRNGIVWEEHFRRSTVRDSTPAAPTRVVCS